MRDLWKHGVWTKAMHMANAHGCSCLRAAVLTKPLRLQCMCCPHADQAKVKLDDTVCLAEDAGVLDISSASEAFVQLTISPTSSSSPSSAVSLQIGEAASSSSYL